MRKRNLPWIVWFILITQSLPAQLPPNLLPSAPTTGRTPGTILPPTSYNDYYGPLPSASTSRSSVPPAYGDYYRDQVQTYKRAPVNPNQYIVDKYYYHNPNISPYLNQMRRSGGNVNNYYAFTRPELDRRRKEMEAEVGPKLRTQGMPTYQSQPDRSPVPSAQNPYYQRYYHSPR